MPAPSAGGSGKGPCEAPAHQLPPQAQAQLQLRSPSSKVPRRTPTRQTPPAVSPQDPRRRQLVARGCLNRLGQRSPSALRSAAMQLQPVAGSAALKTPDGGRARDDRTVDPAESGGFDMMSGDSEDDELEPH